MVMRLLSSVVVMGRSGDSCAECRAKDSFAVLLPIKTYFPLTTIWGV